MQIPQSFIKSVAIETSNKLIFDNSPHSHDKSENSKIPFLGRKEEIRKFLQFLHSSSKRGVFLVTGFRGMGKTSFVNHVIKKYSNDDPKIIPIHLTISQNQPKELDILKLMVNSVFDQYIKYLNETRQHWILPRLHKKIYLQIFLSFFLFFGLVGSIALPLLSQYMKGKSSGLPGFEWITSPFFFELSLTALLLSPLLYLWVKWAELNREKENSGYNRIFRLVKRCQATLSEEKGTNEDIGVSSVGFNVKLFNKAQKTSLAFPIATTKEIEYELRSFLHLVRNDKNLNDRIDFIFIFDELDKVDPAISTSYFEDDEISEKSISAHTYQKNLRERKQAIINIISGLKNFFTEAEARFIFIAGREMFDASLADISDRQSSISSIFTYIFYIESLLKEHDLEPINSNGNEIKAPATSSIGYAIEVFLKYILFYDENKNKESDLKDFRKASLYDLATNLNVGHHDIAEAKQKIIVLLHNFVTYLTYRTNGSPKKLIKTIQEFIIVKAKIDQKKQQILLVASPAPINDNFDVSEKLYLYFGYFDQYRIGFINYLYRPFLIQYGKIFKLFSDNILVSTSYLFDHLLKFHPFAFSKMHLELIPEVLSTSKTPSLREHINQIISHLATNHIRESEISFYDYKFYSRTYNEIVFLSKIFEDESAAFNFTLDESYLVKLHVRGKIKEIRNVYGQSESATKQVFSIAHLNGILGDLHFFDQEYDDAIEAYLDAIRPIDRPEVENLNILDFSTLINNKLKLGLCLEKINSLERALAFYTDCNLKVERFMSRYIANGAHFRIPKSKEKITDDPYYSPILNDLMQLVSQSFLSILFVEEKLVIEGISPQKFFMAIGNYTKIAHALEVKQIGLNHLLDANVFLFSGKLLYFKNSLMGLEAVNEFSVILPFKLKADMSSLFKTFQDSLAGGGKRRKPLLALYMYILGLQEVCNARNIFEDNPVSEKIKKRLVPEIIQYKNVAYYLLEELPIKIDQRGVRFLAVHFRFLANFLSSLGDCLLSIHEFQTKKTVCKISDIFAISQLTNSGCEANTGIELFLKKSDKVSLGWADILKCYALSAKYFSIFGRTISASFQYRKILKIIHLLLGDSDDIYQSNKPSINDILMHVLDKFLVHPCLEITSRNSGNSDRHMFFKYDRLFEKIENQYKEEYIFNNMSNQPDIKEPVILLLQIQLKLNIKIKSNKIPFLISPYNSISTQYGRILELDLYAKYILNELNHDLDIKVGWDLNRADMALAYVFSLESILHILKIYGTDYLLGFSYFASIHFQIATFLLKIENIHFVVADNHQIAKSDSVIGYIQKETNLLFRQTSSYVMTDIVYRYQVARDFYEKAVLLHTGGAEYKKMISEMVYLQDDFNDNGYHFGAAVDRFLLLKGEFENNIRICNTYLSTKAFKNNHLFNFNEYGTT